MEVHPTRKRRIRPSTVAVTVLAALAVAVPASDAGKHFATQSPEAPSAQVEQHEALSAQHLDPALRRTE
jgi:hypothetical protein